HRDLGNQLNFEPRFTEQSCRLDGALSGTENGDPLTHVLERPPVVAMGDVFSREPIKLLRNLPELRDSGCHNDSFARDRIATIQVELESAVLPAQACDVAPIQAIFKPCLKPLAVVYESIFGEALYRSYSLCLFILFEGPGRYR